MEAGMFLPYPEPMYQISKVRTSVLYLQYDIGRYYQDLGK